MTPTRAVGEWSLVAGIRRHKLLLVAFTTGLLACGSIPVAPAMAAPAASPSLAAAIHKSEQISRGRVNATLSLSQGGQTVDLVAYRYAFDRSRGVLAGTVDYRKLFAVDPSLARGANPAVFVFHVVLDFRRHALFVSSPIFLSPAFQRRLPAAARHRPWIELDPRTLATTPGVPKGLVRKLVGVLASGPRSPLQAFQAVSTSSSTAVGAALVGSTPTTEFSSTVDMRRAGAPGRDALSLGQAAGPDWTALVWVDSKSLIREAQFTSPPIAQAGNGQFTVTYRMQGLGGPTRINEPTATQVIPVSALPH